jgi:glutathione synthase/RimK-type ligase-like ATP-grasp enzyme
MEAAMIIMLSDGSGLTARQCGTVLSQAGHQVEALSPDPICLCRFTRHIGKMHRVPALGTDPFGWLAAALDIATRRGAGILLPVQEQVTVMSLAKERIAEAGLLTAVPDFGALVQVQDKVAAFGTLTRLGLPQPRASVAVTRAELEGVTELPVLVKTPIGTASAGVRRVSSEPGLRQLAARYDADGVFEAGGVLVQQPVSGPLAMVQAVFASGSLVAFHACERVREGANGGASHKRSMYLPQVEEHVARLGAELGWHGALSADVILTAEGPLFIDINPRLVEPVNALRSGVDLAGALVEVARSGSTAPQPAGTPDVRTHQLLLAVLGAAQQGGRRRDVLRTLGQAVAHRQAYRGSTEELTPVRGTGRLSRLDPLATVPVTAATLATLIRPAAWRYFTAGATSAYALTSAAWRELQHSQIPSTTP